MKQIYDLVIIGGGPAGLSAGIYAGRAKLNTLIIEKAEFGGQVNKTFEISNYPGARNSNGPKLMAEMVAQAKDFGVHFISAEVTSISLQGDVKTLQTDKGEIQGRAVIISTGASPRKLGFKGEKEFTGRGVAYCSTCDGQFFEGLEVFVIGAGFAAAEEAMFLTKYATKVTVIARESTFTCAQSIADKVLSHPKVEVKFNTEIIEARGEDMVNYAKFINNQTGESFEYHAKKEDNAFGIFVFVGYAPQSDLFKDSLELNESGYILTNDQMETNIPGVYVAGDLRPKALRQIVTAVSDGAIAATSAEKYVAHLKERLGITEEPVAHEKVETPAAPQGALSKGRSVLLNDALRSQLQGILNRLEKEVTLVTLVDTHDPKSIELRDLLLDISDLGEKVSIEVYDKNQHPEVAQNYHIERYPVALLLDHTHTYSGVKFYGVPGGHELNSFILALYNLGGPGQAIDPNVLSEIKALDQPTHIKVCVSLACHLCPDVVVAAQRIAIENRHIETEMIDISLFKDLKTQHKIMSVPAVIINDDTVHFGAKNIEQLVNLIK